MIWLAHALLRLYPRSFRHRYASEIVAYIASERDALRHRGFTDGVRMTLGLVVDVFLTALRLRCRQTALALSRAGNGDVPRLPQPRKRTEMDTLFQDLRYALRQFVRRPGFTAIAVASLGLAIGGNSLIYGMIDGFVFRPFPYPQPDRLQYVTTQFPGLGFNQFWMSLPEFVEFRDNNKAFSSIGAGA